MSWFSKVCSLASRKKKNNYFKLLFFSIILLLQSKDHQTENQVYLNNLNPVEENLAPRPRLHRYMRT